MEYKKRFSSLLIILLLAAPLAARAQQAGASAQPNAAPEAAAVMIARSPADLLPERLAGAQASEDAKQYGPDNLAEMVTDNTAVYREYHVISAASRQYPNARVEVFQMKGPYSAFGLFFYSLEEVGDYSIVKDIGSNAAIVPGALIFWKGNYVVRVGDRNVKRPEMSYTKLGRAVADLIPPSNADEARPPLLDSLPGEGIVDGSQRYFLGPEAIKSYFTRAQEAFSFEGSAEAVMAYYAQGGANQPGLSTLKFFIIEYHTPNFATDAMAKTSSFIESLPDQDRHRIIMEREGNFIVGAINVEDREHAQRLIKSVEYPYTVKWLRNPLWPTNDPFRTRKAAEMLLSTFGLLGLMIMVVLVGGAIFGSIVFLKRRKRQQAIFSDAGGMLRLDIDPFENVLLGLPPKRSED